MAARESSVVIVLFNLKAGVDAMAYERWAMTTDLPIVNGLPSVERFRVLKSGGLLAGGQAPYQYIEILELESLAGLRANASSETMRRVASEFRQFADAPLFIVTEPLE